MKVTNFGQNTALVSTAGTAGSAGGIGGVAVSGPALPGQAIISSSSNTASWQPVISTITSNSSNTLLGPNVNFASGTGITFAVSSNTLTITGTGGTGQFLTVADGGGGTVQAHGNLGSTETIDLANGNYHWGTLDANCTFTFTVAADTKERWFTLELIENGTGGWSPTWPGSVVWLGGTAPPHTTTAGTTTIYAFFTRNGGSTWIGGQLGGSSVTYGTTATEIGGTASAGAASTVSRSDHIHTGVSLVTANGSNSLVRPIANFVSGAGILLSVSSNSMTITGQPTAASITAAGFPGEILIADVHSTPLVFADLIQNEGQDDLVYADP